MDGGKKGSTEEGADGAAGSWGFAGEGACRLWGESFCLDGETTEWRVEEFWLRKGCFGCGKFGQRVAECEATEATMHKEWKAVNTLESKRFPKVARNGVLLPRHGLEASLQLDKREPEKGKEWHLVEPRRAACQHVVNHDITPTMGSPTVVGNCYAGLELLCERMLDDRISKAKAHLDHYQQRFWANFTEGNRSSMRHAFEQLEVLLAREDDFLRQMAKKY
ncbi:hypothetical protein Dimus_018167 [Dionaea muscipula]